MEHAERRAYRNVLAYVSRTPWVVTPEAFAVMTDILARRIEDGWRPSAEDRMAFEAQMAARAPSTRSGAVAVIPLQGMLVPRASLFSAMSGATSMEAFTATLEQVGNDPAVAHIILDVDSPGGSADMIPEAAAVIRDVASRTPITAVVNTMCGSGALWLASQATSISSTPSGSIGSLGAFGAHVDRSVQQANAGIKTTFIRSSVSPYKTELMEPLSAEARAYHQGVMDVLGEQFVGEVAAGRNTSTEDAAANYGQGRMLSSSAALAVGLIDRIETLDEAISRVQADMAAGRPGAVRAKSSALLPREIAAMFDLPVSLVETKPADQIIPGAIESLMHREGFRSVHSQAGHAPEKEAA